MQTLSHEMAVILSIGSFVVLFIVRHFCRYMHYDGQSFDARIGLREPTGTGWMAATSIIYLTLWLNGGIFFLSVLLNIIRFAKS